MVNHLLVCFHISSISEHEYTTRWNEPGSPSHALGNCSGLSKVRDHAIVARPAVTLVFTKVNSGPGKTGDLTLEEAITRARQGGLSILGYVATQKDLHEGASAVRDLTFSQRYDLLTTLSFR